MTIAIVIVLLVIGSIVFHFISPWWFTPLASNWQAIDDTINISLWVTGTVFLLVGLFLAYVVFKFRYNKDRKADYEPENKKLEGWLTVITTIGVAAMLAPGLYVWGQFVTVPENSDIIEVVGQQWHWSYRLPGADGALGKTSINLINEQNPFGIDQNDPSGQDDQLVFSNELHVPLDRPVKVLLRSKDVLHNFAVPQFRVKMDLVPGVVTYLWFTPTRTGRFDILCEELCGMAHFTMRGHIVVDTADDYQHWLNQQITFSESMNLAKGDIVKGKQLYAACVACHGEQGEGNITLNSPRIAGLSNWYLNRQLNYFKNKVRGTNTEDNLGQQMAAMSMSLVDETAVKDVSAYINSLAPTIASHSISGNPSKGKSLYKNCAYCHGDNGQGNYAMNAPKLSGQADWYIKRQLSNYKHGIRGSHPKDLYGNQMVLMSKTLYDEAAINDVVSYINSLEKSE